MARFQLLLGISRMGLCPYCNKNQSANRETDDGRKFWPFCSARCKAADLGAWAKEEYTIPVVELEEEDIRQLEEADPENNGADEEKGRFNQGEDENIH